MSSLLDGVAESPELRDCLRVEAIWFRLIELGNASDGQFIIQQTGPEQLKDDFMQFTMNLDSWERMLKLAEMGAAFQNLLDKSGNTTG